MTGRAILLSVLGTTSVLVTTPEGERPLVAVVTFALGIGGAAAIFAW